MGGLCSRRSTEDGSTSGSIPHVNGHFSYGSGMVYQSRGLSANVKSNRTPSPIGETTDKQPGEPFSFPELTAFSHGMNEDDINDGIPHLSRALSHKTRSAKSKQVAVAKVCHTWIFFGIYIILFLFASTFLGFRLVLCGERAMMHWIKAC